MTIELPIFIVEGNDVGIYKTLEKAINHLEPIDVKNKIYDGYDASGRKLKIDVLNNRIVVTLAEEKPTHAKVLETILRNYLRSMDALSNDEKSSDLKALVNKCIKYSVRFS